MPADGPNPLRPQPDRLPPHRRGPDRALLLGVRAEARGQVRPSHRGHRSRALDRGLGAGDPRRHAVAGAGLGRGALLPDEAPATLSRGRRAAPARGLGVPLLLLLLGAIAAVRPALPQEPLGALAL